MRLTWSILSCALLEGEVVNNNFSLTSKLLVLDLKIFILVEQHTALSFFRFVIAGGVLSSCARMEGGKLEFYCYVKSSLGWHLRRMM